MKTIAPAGPVLRPGTTAALLALLGGLAACGKDLGPFDGARAKDLTGRIVAIGPRQPGTANLRKVAELLAAELKAVSPELELQRQSFVDPALGNGIEYQNLWVEIPGKQRVAGGPIVALAAHYDSKITHPGEQDFTFVGALDAAAACATLVELARHLTGERRLDHDVWLIFFDGEESIDWDWNDEKALIGSRHFARTMNADKERFPNGLAARMKAFVLLDLLGDHEFKIDRDTESNSALLEIFAKAAERLGVREQLYHFESPMKDDHIPFKQQGVRVIDLIDFRFRPPAEHDPKVRDYEFGKRYFPFWHTKDDDMARVSADSLGIVGNLVLEALPVIEKELVK